jgi:hypothetical protein
MYVTNPCMLRIRSECSKSRAKIEKERIQTWVVRAGATGDAEMRWKGRSYGTWVWDVDIHCPLCANSPLRSCLLAMSAWIRAVDIVLPTPVELRQQKLKERQWKTHEGDVEVGDMKNWHGSRSRVRVPQTCEMKWFWRGGTAWGMNYEFRYKWNWTYTMVSKSIPNASSQRGQLAYTRKDTGSCTHQYSQNCRPTAAPRFLQDQDQVLHSPQPFPNIPVRKSALSHFCPLVRTSNDSLVPLKLRTYPIQWNFITADACTSPFLVSTIGPMLLGWNSKPTSMIPWIEKGRGCEWG